MIAKLEYTGKSTSLKVVRNEALEGLSEVQSGNWKYDIRSGSIMLSDRAAAILGIEELQLDSALLYAFFLPGSRVKLLRSYFDAKDGGTELNVSLNISTAKGISKVVELIGIFIMNRDGSYTELLGLIKDVTCKKKRLALDYAMISHELRSPVMITKLNLDYLQKLLASQGNLYPCLVLNKMEHELNLIMNLLGRYFLMEEKQLTVIDHSLFDLNQISEAILIQIKNLYPKHKFNFIPSCPPALVMGDRNKIAQAVLSFLNNAARFSPDSSKVILQISNSGVEVSLCVTDTGTGLGGNSEQQIFKKQGHSNFATKKSFRLGPRLYLLKQIIQAHGGKVSAKNTGSGAAFGFTLPIQPRYQTIRLATEE